MTPSRNPTMLRTRTTIALCCAALLLVLAVPLAAQETGLAGQSLGRPYRFVFLAYALLWILVFGWVVSVGRRISKLAGRMRDPGMPA